MLSIGFARFFLTSRNDGEQKPPQKNTADYLTHFMSPPSFTIIIVSHKWGYVKLQKVTGGLPGRNFTALKR